jgi:hypothetical protein
MGFKLNIGKDGSGTTGFGKTSSEVMAKCRSMATYMGTLQDNITGGVDGGAGTPGGFNGNYGSGMNKNDGGTMAYQTDNTYIETKEEEGYMSGVTRGGKTPEVGDKFTSDNDSRKTSTTTTVTDQNNSSDLTKSQKVKGVKVKYKTNTSKKDDREYYPANHPKAGQIKPK